MGKSWIASFIGADVLFIVQKPPEHCQWIVIPYIRFLVCSIAWFFLEKVFCSFKATHIFGDEAGEIYNILIAADRFP